MAIAGAAFIATGCGPTGGSGATEAAKDSAALDLVPKSAVGYVTVDTDFEGDNWKQFNELATAFDADFKGVVEELSESSSDDEDKDEVDYSKDIDPWLGESAGAALVSGSTEDAEFFMWVELEDRAAFEKWAEGEDWEQGKEIGDYATYTDPDDDTNHVAYTDDLAVFAPSREDLEARVEYDGDSITDADGVGDAIDEAGDDALVTLVVSGEGVRAAVEENDDFASLKDVKQLKDFRAAALSLSAEDEGMRLTGFVGAEGDEEAKNIEHPILEDLPGDTVFALGGHDFGGALQRITRDAGKDNAQIQQGVGAAEAALGVDMDDLAKAFDGEFVLGMSADDQGLGSLAGGVAGAAMGGGLGGVDTSSLARSASIVLAFEETGESSETLDKLAAAVGGLSGASAAPKTGTSGDFETKTMSVAGFDVTTAASDDVAVITFGKDVLASWGDESLGDNDAYTSAWEAADAPGESAGVIWFDAGRVAKLAGVEGGDEREVGGFVGWLESDGSDARFGAFMHVPEA